MKLSIIVPVYNASNFLDKCVGSLVSQTLKEEYEIILVNDCSTDDSLAKMQKWREHRPDIIKIIDSKINMRQGGARNLGLNVAKGDYIAFVDSDDWVDINAYESMLSADNADCEVIYSPSYYKVKSETDISEIKYTGWLYTGRVSVECRKKLLINNIGVCNTLWKKSFIDKYGFRFIEKLAYEDVLWGYKIISKVNVIACVDKSFYYYRVNPNSTTATIRPNSSTHSDYSIIADECMRCLTEMLDNAEYKHEIDYIKIDMYYFILLRRKQLKKADRKVFKNKYFREKYNAFQRFKLWASCTFPSLYAILKKGVRR